jgi:hypothetical protein
MKKHLLPIIALLMIVNINASAEDERNDRMTPDLRRRTLVLDIDTRVLEQKQEVVWNESCQKLTFPGAPVSLKLVGSNVIVSVQFTPYVRRHNQNVLVAQGQIWIDVPNQGISYHTSMQTIPLDFNEPIYFFPLGQSNQLDASIEIVITVYPYREDAPPVETTKTDDR